MIVLGWNYKSIPMEVHETGACIVKDGVLIAAINEDRLTGHKHDGTIPFRSLFETLKIGISKGIKPQNIDAVAIPVSSPNAYYFSGIRKNVFKPREFVKSVFRYPVLASRESYMKAVLKNFSIEAPIYYVPHHECHRSNAFYASGFDKASVFTIDGIGPDDFKTSTVALHSGNEVKVFGESFATENSLGIFYEKATDACGFNLGDGEGKTTGLACYGDPNKYYDEVSKMISIDGLTIKGNYGIGFGEGVDNKINFSDKKLFSPYRHVHYKVNPFKKFLGKKNAERDIAAAAQRVLEERASELVKNGVLETGVGDVCISGGVALNVKMNKAIREIQEVENVFIFPNPGDGGLDAGAALKVCQDLSGAFTKNKMTNAYLGSEFSDDEIEETINDFGLGYEKLSNPSAAAADFIAEGKVVGWFQGQMEYGPRALGNRSVLADPRDPKMRDRINTFLKKRDWFMPFAPSMLDKAKDEYLVNPTESPFMIMAFDVPKEKRNEIAAAVHVDGTTRPHTVTKDANPRYFELIKKFEQNSGVPVVLNTSFNKHGFVMVRTPLEALNHLAWNCIEELVIGSFHVFREFRESKPIQQRTI